MCLLCVFKIDLTGVVTDAIFLLAILSERRGMFSATGVDPGGGTVISGALLEVDASQRGERRVDSLGALPVLLPVLDVVGWSVVAVVSSGGATEGKDGGGRES